MSKKSKLLAVLIVMALIPATASATVTRVQGLGGWPGATYVVKDAVNPVHFPSTLAYYSHLLYAEFSAFDPQNPTVKTKLDRVGAWYDNVVVMPVGVLQGVPGDGTEPGGRDRGSR